jgi:hypothetical protein
MRLRLTAALPAAFAATLAVAAAAGATLVPIYRDSMETTAQRGQLVKLSGANCKRGGSKHALRVVVGKHTAECAYRTPVVGRDLEIAATERLLSGTPKGLQKKVFLAIGLRAGGGAKYQLTVFPRQRKVQLRKYLGGGSIKYLAIEKAVSKVGGINAANQLRLRAFNITSGPEQGQCDLFAYVGGKLVANVTDPGAGEMTGRASSVSVGSTNSAAGAVASIDDVVVRVPSPF